MSLAGRKATVVELTAHDDAEKDTDDEVPDGHADHNTRDRDVFRPDH